MVPFVSGAPMYGASIVVPGGLVMGPGGFVMRPTGYIMYKRVYKPSHLIKA